jgi:hypothetical protein
MRIVVFYLKNGCFTAFMSWWTMVSRLADALITIMLNVNVWNWCRTQDFSDKSEWLIRRQLLSLDLFTLICVLESQEACFSLLLGLRCTSNTAKTRRMGRHFNMRFWSIPKIKFPDVLNWENKFSLHVLEELTDTVLQYRSTRPTRSLTLSCCVTVVIFVGFSVEFYVLSVRIGMDGATCSVLMSPCIVHARP